MTRPRPRSLEHILACMALALLLCSACSAERLFFEAESMTADGVNWVAGDHFGGWYSGAPSGGKMLSGAQGGAGEARHSVEVTAGGKYRLWMRYLCGGHRGPFKVTVVQGGAQLGEKTFDQTDMRLAPEQAEKWGSGYIWAWESLDVELNPGEVEVVVSKVDPMTVSWITRHIDCFVLTDDLKYEPNVTDFLAPLYIKVKMGPAHKDPCVIHIFGRKPRSPWWMAHSNIYRTGLVVNQHYTGYGNGAAADSFLTANTESPWVDIAPLLDIQGENRIELMAMQEYYQGLKSSDYTVLVSKTASEDGIFKRFARSGKGSVMLLLVDLLRREDIRSDVECSSEALREALKTPKVPGKRPVKFPIFTGCAVSPGIHGDQTVSNEAKIISILGMNGSNKSVGGASYFHLTQGCFSQPKLPEIRASIMATAKSLVDGKQVKDTIAVRLMDEPGSDSLDHIVGCQFCVAKFRDYLRKQGLKPSLFGKDSWEEIKPVAAGEKEPELYYYSVLFRSQVLTDFFKIATDLIESVDPNIRTTANFAEDHTFYGNGLQYGVDWFEVLEQGALTYGWTEDWLNYATSKQLCGYRADLMRAACAPRKRQFGMYTILTNGWDTPLKAVTEIGHGVTCIHEYNYGPYYALSSDASSNNYSLYAPLKRLNHAIGAVEDYLVGATVPRSRIGLVYSQTTDIWTLNDGYSVFGRERYGLYLLLRHLGYPVDIVTEKDIAAGRAKDYRMLFYIGSHAERDVLPRLLAWVRSGGILYICPGGLTLDQFNRPLGFDALAGLNREPFVYKSSPGRDFYEFPSLEKLDTVDFQGGKMDAVCGFQKTKADKKSAAIAAFADGSPAVATRSLGKGRIVCSGFFVGLSYCKDAVTAWKSSQETVNTDGATDYPKAPRSLMSRLMGLLAWKPAVTTNNPMVEANLLEGPKGYVITLSNWSGRPVKDVVVTIALPGKLEKPFAVEKKLKSVSQKPGMLRLKLDMDAFDFIVVPRSSAKSEIRNSNV